MQKTDWEFKLNENKGFSWKMKDELRRGEGEEEAKQGDGRGERRKVFYCRH